MENIVLLPTIFVAAFDPSSGKVTGVGPSHAFENNPHKIVIDKEIAESILEGTIQVHNCFVDTTATKLEIAEIKSMFKIDDVLHRVIENKWADIENPDITLSYDKENKKLTIELTEAYYGTKSVPEKFHPISKRKVIWNGDTVMNLLITEYNDPNILYKMLSLTVSELVENKKEFTDLELPDRFSVYTRRLFKNYVLEDL